MSMMELVFGIHKYTVEYEVVNGGFCSSCGEFSRFVEQIEIIYIVRQERCLDGKDVKINSKLGKIISKLARKLFREDLIWQDECSSCRDII